MRFRVGERDDVRAAVAVEFRHRSWLDDANRREVIAFLREQNVPYVIVDEPQGFPNSVPAVWEATSTEMAVVRFHGPEDPMVELVTDREATGSSGGSRASAASASGLALSDR